MVLDLLARTMPGLAPDQAALTWLIALPLLAAPLIYLLGRRVGPDWAWLSALGVLLLNWLPLLLVVRSGGAQSVMGSVVFRADGLSLLVVGLLLALAMLVTVGAGPARHDGPGQETRLALVLGAVGAGIGLACAGDLFNLWVWFEILAVASYALACLERERPSALSASVIYLMQSSAGSILALLGIALVVGQTGTLDLGEIRESAVRSPALLAAGALMLIGFGVKAALVPLHTWLPDVYARATGGASALLAGAITKLGLLAVLRAIAVLAGITPTWGALLLAVGVLNIAVGNLLALRQTRVTRLLACSSLAHVGYIVLGIGIAIRSGEVEAAQGGLFHFVTHGLMVALAFLAVGALGNRPGRAPASSDESSLRIVDLAGAAVRQPLATLALTVGALGLGGLPPLAGFMSEWQIFAAGIATRDPVIAVLVAFAALNVVLSLAYYAPLVGALYRREPSAVMLTSRPLAMATGAPLAVLVLAVFALGVWPGLLSGLTGPAGAALLAAFGV